MKALALSLALLLTACGYRLATPGLAHSYPKIAVPFVKGDTSGLLTDYLVRELEMRGRFDTGNARYILQAKIIKNDKEAIGWRYDREELSDERIQRLMPVESKRDMVVEVTLLDSYNDTIVYGPSKVHSRIDYDYVNFDTISELGFTPPGGARTSTLAFSLGQLDAIEGAETTALDPLYRTLAHLIAAGLDSCDAL